MSRTVNTDTDDDMVYAVGLYALGEKQIEVDGETK